MLTTVKNFWYDYYKMVQRKKIPLKTTCFVLGLVAGLVFVHPYTMMILFLTIPSVSGEYTLEVKGIVSFFQMIFSPEMFPMSSAFILFSGFTGFLIGMVLEREKRLVVMKYKNEKRLVVLQAVRQLIMVISHYFLNAALIIGTRAGQLKTDIKESQRENIVNEIKEQAKQIETLLTFMRKTEFAQMLDGSSADYKKILDISTELEKQLRQKK